MIANSQQRSEVKSILVLRHEPFEHLGYFGEILREHAIPFSYRDLGEPLDLQGRSGLIIMGGPQSANDSLPALSAELGLIIRAVRAEIPILGICLGAQLNRQSPGSPRLREPRKRNWMGARILHPGGAG